MTDDEAKGDRNPGRDVPGGAPREISWKLLAAITVLVGVVAFLPSLAGGFIYDDRPLIEGNHFIKSFGYWKRWLTTDFWDVSEELRRFGSRMIYWRPAITASYALDWKLSSGSPFLFHVTNIAWQGAGALLAFLALRRWIGVTWPAFLVAIAFAVHPTKAESVAWIAGRTDVFCFVACLVAAQGMAMRIAGKKGGLAVEIAGTALAYLTKEQAIVLPAFAAIETWVALGRPAIDRKTVVQLVRAGVPQLGVALAYLFVRSRVLPVRQKYMSLKAADYFGQLFESIGRYVTLTFFPHDLSVQQALSKSSGGRLVLSPGYIALGVASVVVLLALAFACRRRLPVVTIGLGFFFVTLLPTSNLVPMGMLTMISERFLYMPSLGIALAVGGAVAAIDPRSLLRRVAHAALAAAALSLLVVCWRRSADYDDEHRFWARELSLHPDSPEAWRFVISSSFGEKRFHDALQASSRAQQMAAKWYSHVGLEAAFLVTGLDALALVIRDRDTASLRGLDEFLGQLLVYEGDVAKLDLPMVRMTVPRSGGPITARFKNLRPQILISRAMIASRLGDDARATELANAARSECPECTTQVAAIALVRARAGDYAGAHEVLDVVAAKLGEKAVEKERKTVRDAELFRKQAELAPEGPIKLHLQAKELSTLDAWGRAYALLEPHKEEIKKAPGFALGFAELAFRAGDEKTAREVAEGVLPKEKIEPTFREWRKKMGWL